MQILGFFISFGPKKCLIFEKKILIFEEEKHVEILLPYVTPWAIMGSLKKISPFGPAVWSAIANI